MSDNKFTNTDDEILIDLVRQHPPLYSLAGKSYEDMVIKRNIWKEIGTMMKRTDKACQTRWKNIRDYYQKKKREAMKGQKTNSTGNCKVENFRAKFKQLSFLDNISIEKRSSKSRNYPVTQSERSSSIFVESQDVVCELQEVSSDMEDSEVTHSQASLGTDTPLSRYEPHEDQECSKNQSTRVEEPNSPPSKRKRRSISKDRSAAVVEEIREGRSERSTPMKHLQSEPSSKRKDDTPISMFFRSIALTVEELPPYLQTRAKVKVLEVISDLEVEHQQRTMITHGCRCVPTEASTDSPN